MKKIFAVVLLISLVCFSGAAFAKGRMNHNVQTANCDFNRHHSRFAPDMPQEIREKATEMAKLNIDLDEALTSHPLNKTKARETYGKILKLQQELDVWEFEKYLDDLENFYKQTPEPETQTPEAE